MLGPVATAGADIPTIFDISAGSVGEVRVQVWDRDLLHGLGAVTQWRTYRWANGRFTQTEGPTSFPLNPPSVELAIDGDLIVGETVAAGRVVDVSITVSNTGTLAAPNGLLVTIGASSQLEPAGTGVPGGSGVANDWTEVKAAREAGAFEGLPLIAAGGLKPETVAQVVRDIQPYAVDVSSGVESELGVKSEQKIRDFIAAARA